MSKAESFVPDIGRFYEAEARILDARVEGIRAAIQHAGEKGHSAELQVRQLLRDYLPAEYGLSTGFIAYHDPESFVPIKGGIRYRPDKDVIHLSKQIDIIIYDALRCGPLVRLDACDVFPLEAVYGYVEVKTSIASSTDLRSLLNQSSDLRRPKTRFYWTAALNNPTGAALDVGLPSVSIRSFVFVFDGHKLGDAGAVKAKLESEAAKCRRRDAFIGGMYVNSIGSFGLQPINDPSDPRKGTVMAFTDNPLSSFKHRMLVDLSRYPRMPVGSTPALDLYTMRLDELISKSTKASAPKLGGSA